MNLDPVGHDKPLRLNPSLMVHETPAGLVVTVADCDPMTLTGDYTNFLAVLAEINGNQTAVDIQRHLMPDVGPQDVMDTIRFAIESNLVKVADNPTALSSPRLLKWDRQIRNFTNLRGVGDADAIGYHNKLAESHLAILGVGGVGGYLATSCAMIGVSRLTIIDFDTVELSNTSRQILYTESDVGSPKLDAAMRDLTRRSPAAHIQAINCQITDDDSLAHVIGQAVAANGDIDLLLLAADQPRGKLQYIVDRICQKYQTPYLLLGPHSFSRAFIGPLVVPGKTLTYAELIPETTITSNGPQVNIINSQFQPNIMDPFNGLAAKMAMVEVVKYLTGYASPQTLTHLIDLDTTSWELDKYDLAAL